MESNLGAREGSRTMFARLIIYIVTDRVLDTLGTSRCGGGLK